MAGRRFTYFCEVGCKLSKLDRILVNDSFLASFPTAYFTALPREYSDHSPVILSTEKRDFGPPPFRFFNSWIQRDGFGMFVIDTWYKFDGDGAPDRYFANKLKFLKNEIKSWRRVEHEKENKTLRDLKVMVLELDLQAESRMLNREEIGLLRENKQKIIEMEKLAKSDLIQKAKIKWLKDGDENSRFYHNTLKVKNRKCNIRGLMVNGCWTEKVGQIKQEAHRFFCAKFHEDCNSRPSLSNSTLHMLSEVDREFLEAPFELEEIKNAIWNCGNEKAPGPNGFTFKFFKV